MGNLPRNGFYSLGYLEKEQLIVGFFGLRASANSACWISKCLPTIFHG